MRTWSEIYPPFGVAIRCGDVELSALTPDVVPELVELAIAGTVRPDTGYPFVTNWALLPPAELRLSAAQFYFDTWGSARPESWQLLMVVRRGGQLVGCQDLRATQFPTTRIVHTGSWLGLAHQGRGTGTLMRQMVCAFAFDALGAAQCRTEAFLDNPVSQRVSAKVGYERFDQHPVDRLGEPAEEVYFRMIAEQFNRPPEPVTYAGVDAFRSFIDLVD